MLLSITATVVIFLLSLATLRLYYILPHASAGQRQYQSSNRTRPAHILIVLGSGGHTTEMLMMLQNLDITKFTRRTYIVSSGDNFSAERAEVFEKGLLAQAIQAGTTAKHLHTNTYSVETVHRARKVHQSIYTAPFSSFFCLIHCIHVLWFGARSIKSVVTSAKMPPAKQLPSHVPDIILTNGPGTGVIVVLATLILRFLSLDRGSANTANSSGSRLVGDRGMRTIYVESWARVKRLSLSGHLLLPLVDRFIVQWESLLPATKGKGIYLSNLVEVPKPLSKP